MKPRLLGLLSACWLLAPGAALASQATLVMPVTGPHTMADMMGRLNLALLSIASCNSGNSAPTNGTGGTAFAGECWANTTANPWVFQYTDNGTNWSAFGSLNTSTHAWTLLGSAATITGGTVTVNPTAASTNQGLVITQTSPSGSVAGPLNLDTIDATFSTTTITGAGRDAFGSLNSNAYGLRVNTTLAGSFGGASAYSGFISALRITGSGGTSADKLAMVGTAYVNVPVTSGGGVVGNSNWSFIDSSGSLTTFLEGYESDSGIATGGSAPTRVGISIWNVGAVRGSTLDAAIAVTNIAAGGEFAHLVALSGYANGNTLASLSSTADLFFSDQAITIAHVFNAGNFTVTGNILNFPGVVLAGDATLTLTKNVNGAFASTVKNASAGTGAIAEFVADNGINNMTAGIGGTGVTGLYQGRGFVTANGTAPLIVGTSGNAALQLVINNAEVGRLQTSGGLSIGTTTDPGAGAIEINNAAFLIRTATSFTNGSGAGAGTLTNAPAAGNPTKWIAIDDNGTTRKFPTW